MTNKFYFFIAHFAIVFGSFLVIIQPYQGVTGAIIDIQSVYSRLNFFIGLSITLLGIILVTVLITKEKQLSKKKKK